MHSLTKALVSLAALVLIAAAPPSEPEAAQSGDILVTGQRNPAQAMRGFVGSVAIPSADKQLARFYDPVCPYVAGLDKRSNEFVEQRMRRVAAAAGMKVADEQCAANALLYVAPDKAKLLADWRKSDSILWGSELTDGEIRQLVHSTEAATSWQVLAYRGSDGRGLARNRIARLSNPNEAAKVEMSPGSAIDNVGAPISRILNPLRIGFDISVLVVDGRAAGGSNLTQLADFAAMQLFARTKLQAGATQPAPTILTLLDDARTGRPAPASLTEWDLAYLRALYSYSDMYVAGAHRGDLAKRMTRFIRTDGDARAKQPD